jgi:hypothetical protein
MDPSGDVLLALSTPNAPFAVWDGGEDGPVPTEPTANPESAEPTPHAEEDVTTIDDAAQDNEAYPQEDSLTDTISTEPVTFLGSSRHPILASPVFKAMLTEEGKKAIKPMVLYEEVSKWDTEALVIVMNVLDGYC